LHHLQYTEWQRQQVGCRRCCIAIRGQPRRDPTAPTYSLQVPPPRSPSIFCNVLATSRIPVADHVKSPFAWITNI
jgi:hypothetical protein